jgi:hypothetical protein
MRLGGGVIAGLVVDGDEMMARRGLGVVLRCGQMMLPSPGASMPWL